MKHRKKRIAPLSKKAKKPKKQASRGSKNISEFEAATALGVGSAVRINYKDAPQWMRYGGSFLTARMIVSIADIAGQISHDWVGGDAGCGASASSAAAAAASSGGGYGSSSQGGSDIPPGSVVNGLLKILNIRGGKNEQKLGGGGEEETVKPTPIPCVSAKHALYLSPSAVSKLLTSITPSETYSPTCGWLPAASIKRMRAYLCEDIKKAIDRALPHSPDEAIVESMAREEEAERRGVLPPSTTGEITEVSKRARGIKNAAKSVAKAAAKRVLQKSGGAGALHASLHAMILTGDNGGDGVGGEMDLFSSYQPLVLSTSQGPPLNLSATTTSKQSTEGIFSGKKRKRAPAANKNGKGSKNGGEREGEGEEGKDENLGDASEAEEEGIANYVHKNVTKQEDEMI